MSRRSPPQKVLDDQRFPVRVLLVVPEEGFGARLDELLEWLRFRVGPGHYAHHGGGRGPDGRDRTGVYLRSASVAAELLQAFPDLVLADCVGPP